MPESYRVIDLFAGPGGLAEGFASLRRNGKPPFEIALSVEKEPSAHRTLLLRSFLRQFKDEWPSQYAGFLAGGEEPDWAELHPVQWKAAQEHALELELGSDKATEQLRPVTEAPQAIEALPASEVLRRSRPARSSEKAIVLPRWPHQKGVPRPVLPARQLLR